MKGQNDATVKRTERSGCSTDYKHAGIQDTQFKDGRKEEEEEEEGVTL